MAICSDFHGAGIQWKFGLTFELPIVGWELRGIGAATGNPNGTGPGDRSVPKAGRRGETVDRLGLALEARKLAPQIVEKEVGHVVVKPRFTTTRSTARSWRFSGNVYAGTSQPRSRSRVGDVEHRVVGHVVVEREREHRQLAAVGDQLEGTDLRDLATPMRVATSRACLLDALVAVEARGAGSCSTARRPGPPGARSSARTSACCRRGS